ncbi:MAG: 4-hydroxy-tetrahydrodipicolinate synthase, partial [Oscillospiraceae bacterium]
MKKIVFTGCATALVTPMNDDYSVNYTRLNSLIEEQISGGVDSIVVCGTTGESATLNHKEHVGVIKTAVETANGRVPIIAGTGSNDTFYAAELSKEAEQLGVDALLMVTPYYNKTSQAGLVKHYNYVADRVSTPIIVYNVPSRTGTNIKPETYKELAKHPNIVATKEANGDLSSVAKTAALCGDDLNIYSGNDDQGLAILALGGIGIISVLSNILPKVPHDICQKFFDGDISGSRAIQLKYIELIDALFADVNPIPVKEAMNILGMNVGSVRLPLVPTSDSVRA